MVILRGSRNYIFIYANNKEGCFNVVMLEAHCRNPVKKVSLELISHAASEAVMMKTPGMPLMDDKKYINYMCPLQYFFFFRNVNQRL